MDANIEMAAVSRLSDMRAVAEFAQNRDYHGYVNFLRLKPNEVGYLDPIGMSNSPLIIASSKGLGNFVMLLVENGVHINQITSHNRDSALLEAIRRGRLDMVQLFLELDADVNHKDSKGDTPLILAAEYGFEVLICQLLVMGAEVNALNNLGKSALITACNAERRDIALMLVQACGDPDLSRSVKTPRMMIEEKGIAFNHWLQQTQSGRSNYFTSSQLLCFAAPPSVH